jgi:hypothetical protein
MLRHSIHDKRFVITANPHGLSTAETVFHYLVEGRSITGTYAGGRIRTGHVVGVTTSPETVEMLYHCITTDGELLAGHSRGHVSVDRDGRVKLDFNWSWLSGKAGGGQSQYLELRE